MAETQSSGGSGLPDNLAGALSYFLGALTGILFFIIDRQRPFVRFHAAQAIVATIAWVIISVGLMVLSIVLAVIPLIGWLISTLLYAIMGLGGFALWLWLMWQAYQGKKYELPIVGPYAVRLAAEAGGTA